MNTQTKTYKPRIIRGRVELWVPHGSGEIAFAPLTSPDTYKNVGAEILKNKQRIPTGDETASLLHVAYCVPEMSGEPEYHDIRDKMRGGWIHVFNKFGWTHEGKYVLQDSTALGLSQPFPDLGMLKEQLHDGTEVKGVLFSKDGKVRFAPRDTYKLGEHTPSSLALDGGVIAEFGVEGARKIAEVSQKFNCTLKTLGVEVNEGDNLVQRVFALYDYYGWLYLNGDYQGGDWDGCASGVWN